MSRILIFIFMGVWTASAMASETPIREGLGFPQNAAPAFGDEQMLQSIQSTVTTSKIAPVQQIELQGTTSDLGVKVVGDSTSMQFVCEIQGGKPVCQSGHPIEIVNQVTIPFGNLKQQGIASVVEHSHAWSSPAVAGFVAASFVAVYVGKKIYNRLMTGKMILPEDDHDHGMFPTAEQMTEEIAENREVMERALARAEATLESDLLAVATGLAKVAACGHDHHPQGPGHSHGPKSGFSCQDVTPQQAQDARESIFKRLPKFATTFAKDFYREMISPYVTLVKAIFNKDKRRQAWGFLDVIMRRMIVERGVGAALATAGFIGITQTIWEAIESAIMPNGLHLFCTVVNAALLGVAATVYTKYHCFIHMDEMRNLSVEEKRQAMRRIARQETPMIKSLHTLFRNVERDARYMRHLNLTGTAESRERAVKLGKLKEELNLLTLKYESQQPVQDELYQWLQELSELRDSFEANPQANCFKALAS